VTTRRTIVSLKVIRSAMQILIIVNRAQIASIVILTCRQYAMDCDGCIGSGCLYCPKDGVCASGVIPQDYFLGSFGAKDVACSSEDYRPVSCVAAADNVFNDLLYTEQSWMYDLIDVESVWRQGITGAGVHIRINDNGVNGDHPELSARFDKEGSCEIYLPYNLMEDTHGTAMDAIAAGEANNDECSAGIAPGATVSSCVMVATSPSLLTPEASDGYSFLLQGIEYVDISSNSWGVDICQRLPFRRGRDRMLQDECPFPDEDGQFYFPCVDCSPEELALITAPNEQCVDTINRFCSSYYVGYEYLCQEYIDIYVPQCYYTMLNDGQKGALETAIQEGRTGKGVIFTFAAGNDNLDGQDVNMEGFMHSRYTISVAAVGRNGIHASYSTPGAPNLISAPGGDIKSLHNHVVANAAGGCYGGPTV
jgi:subtilisin family serine protease